MSDVGKRIRPTRRMTKDIVDLSNYKMIVGAEALLVSSIIKVLGVKCLFR